MKEQMKQYLLKKLHEMEEERQRLHKAPNVTMGREIRSAVQTVAHEAMEELIAQGIVESGRTINDRYYRLNPENATE